MNLDRRAMSTAAPVGPVFVGMHMPDRRGVPVAALLAAFFLTATPTSAATNRFEDTAARGRRAFLHVEDSAVVKRIQALQAYEAGWDGHGSVGPTVETVKQALAFARELEALGDIAQPYISLANDGEINFYWKTTGIVLDLGFTGTGTYSYFGQTPAGAEFTADEAHLGQPLPAELVVALRA